MERVESCGMDTPKTHLLLRGGWGSSFGGRGELMAFLLGALGTFVSKGWWTTNHGLGESRRKTLMLLYVCVCAVQVLSVCVCLDTVLPKLPLVD